MQVINAQKYVEAISNAPKQTYGEIPGLLAG